MSITSNPATPPPPEEHSFDVSTTPRWVVIAFVIAFLLVGYLLYASHSERQDLKAGLDQASKKSELLSAQLDRANSRIADLKGQLDVTSQKLGLTQDELARASGLAQAIRKQQKTSDEQLAQIGQAERETSSKVGQVSTDLTGTKSDVEATKKDLEATKGKLERAVGDLGVQSGLIARSHDEVEELKRLGERNIFEFDLPKTKQPQRVGPIMVQLRKTDTKHFRYTMSVIADDKNIEKKDKTVGEPVQFYVRGNRAPYEIVVFTLSKDHATGYLSTPKGASAPAPAPSNQ
jgi:septal ring factor EnvC (AmiA/AmiB activator)